MVLFKDGVVYACACPIEAPPLGTVYKFAFAEAFKVAV